MKIVCISDTHEKHDRLAVPDGDVLIFAGDCTMSGDAGQLQRFNAWLGALPHKHKLWVFGNHEWTCDPRNKHYISGHESLITAGLQLNGSGVTIEGVRFWGSPMAPRFHGWAFGLESYESFQYWRRVPDDTDVLVTHGPAREIMDQNIGGEHCGCPNLLERIEEVEPILHVFGHIHTRYGTESVGRTLFVNASVVDDSYDLVRPAVCVDIYK